MNREYAEYAANMALELIAIDSPSGYTDRAAEWVCQAFTALGFDAHMTQKGGVMIDL
jgi:putative aminopeptidase FrvX